MSMNRRDFLRLAPGGVLAGGALSGTAAQAKIEREGMDGVVHARQHPPTSINTVSTVCGVCFWKCGIQVEQDAEGRPLHLRGNPDHPSSRGRLCPRGVGGIGMHDSPDRLTQPQIRKAARGLGLFRPASWEAATNDAAARLQRVIDEHGVGAVAFMIHGLSEHHFGLLAKAMGTPHQAFPAYAQCKGPRDVGFRLTFGRIVGSPEPLDMENSRCIVLFGSHIGENMHNSQAQEFVTARQNGAKIIVVDPRRSTAADKAHYWLPIKPGTDMALQLAWLHILIRDQAWDHEFVSQHCSGFEPLREHVAGYTPEWAAAETQLPVEIIEQTARAIIDAAPAVLFHPGRFAVWHGNDTQRSRAIALLTALTGAWGAKGGYFLPQKVSLPAVQGLYPDMPAYPEPAPRRDPGYPFAYTVTSNGVRDATLNGKIKAWVVSGTNLLRAMPGAHETRAAIDKLDALIVADILPTEITQYADVLFPATSYLEHPDYVGSAYAREPYVALNQRAAPPVGEARCESEIAKGLAEALGLGEYFPWRDDAEVTEKTIAAYNADHPDRPIDLAALRANGVAYPARNTPIYRAGAGGGPDGQALAGVPLQFPEFDGRITDNKVRLYSHDLAKVYRDKLEAGESAVGLEPLPTYYRPRGGPPGTVRLISGRSPVHSFSRTQNLAPLHGRVAVNEVWVSPRIAKAFGELEDGESVILINQDGVKEGPCRLKVTARIRDDVVFLPHGHGHNSRHLQLAGAGASDTELSTQYAVDPIAGTTALRVNFVRLSREHGA